MICHQKMFRANLAVEPVLLFLLLSLSACQSANSFPVTPLVEVNSVVETETIEATEIKFETAEPMPMPTATFLPTPTETSMLAFTPTVNPKHNLERISELPVIATNFTILDDGKLLAYQDTNEVIQILDTSDWQTKWELDLANWEWSGYMVRDFSVDGQYLAGGGVNDNVYVWDIVAGETIYVFDVPFHTVNNISFSPDGRYLAVSAIETYSGQSPMVWDLDTGQQIQNPISLQNYGPNVLAVKFIPGQTNVLAITTANLKSPEEFEEGERIGGLYFWSIDTGEVQEVVSGIGGIGLGTSPSGLLIGAEVDESYHFWDMQNGKEMLILKWENLGEVKSVEISDTGMIAAVDTEGLTVWNVHGEIFASLVPERAISKIEFFSDNELLIAYDADPSVPLEIWRVGE